MLDFVVLLIYACIYGKKRSYVQLNQLESKEYTKTIQLLAADYEDDMNSMISITEREEDMELYEEFYEEFDNRIRIGQTMNMIFFGPPDSFMRLDSETILHILSHTKKQSIPITRALLAWDMLTDGKTAAFLQGREFLAFDSLLNFVPEEDLYYVNFGDPSVLRYFANHYVNLHRRKFGVLIAAYRRYYGTVWLANSTYINELGYLLCGFPSSDLKEIPPKTFKELNQNVLGKLSRCDSKQSKTLYNIATHLDAYGEPYKWSSQDVSKLGSLFACIPRDEISALRLDAIPAISKQVIKAINLEKLDHFTKQQILRMNKKARRTYILRMLLKTSLDMSKIGFHERILIPHNTLMVTATVVTLLMSCML